MSAKSNISQGTPNFRRIGRDRPQGLTSYPLEKFLSKSLIF
jgi:hypothetical protein